MDLDRFAALIGPPPAHVPPVDWADVEARLGVPLPADFRAFAAAYGPIDLGEYVWIWSPAGSEVPYQVRTLGWLRSNRDANPGSAPYRFWPEPWGLLKWATSRAGDDFFWDPSGSEDPDTWPVVARFAHHRWHRFDLTMTDLVAAMVTDGIDWSPGHRTGPLPARYGPDLSLERPRPTPVAPLTPSRSGLDRLLAALPAAAATRDRAGPWADVDAPADYRELLDATGPGTLGGVLRLLAPGGPDGFDLAAEHAAADLADPPAGLYPDPPGMRLWGRMATGETLWWLPAWHSADHWPVVVIGTGWQRIDLPTTAFLAEWLDRRMDLPILDPAASPGAALWTPAADGVPPAPPPSTRRRDPFALLATLLGPPDPGEVDWTDTERELGRRLPDDFKRLVTGYGEAVLDGLSFGDPVEHTQWFTDLLDDEQPPFPVVMCGGTEGRDLIGWNATDPNPNAWTVVVERAGELEPFNGTLTDFVIAVATGRTDLIGTTPSWPRLRP
ncbi:hypothetical protein [Micromonospora sp. NPDC047740]|uniref:hypothetical protein n=1 Tax=Micromonospora sp. NPDC047740 TaxID=3364254 RepID=UPI003723EE0D